MGRTYNPSHYWRRTWAAQHLARGGKSVTEDLYKLAVQMYLAGATAKAAGIATAVLYRERYLKEYIGAGADI